MSNGGCAFTAKGRRICGICGFAQAIFDDLLSISPASSASMADIDEDTAGDAGDAEDVVENMETGLAGRAQLSPAEPDFWQGFW